MNNPFHSQGPEFDEDIHIKEYMQQLDKEYGNTIPAKIWKAILLSLKKTKLYNSREQNRKNYLKA